MGSKVSFKTVKIAVNIVLLGTLLGISGCAKKGHSGAGGADGSEYGVGDTMRFYGSNISPAQEKELLAQTTYYFGYDRYDLNDCDMMSVYAHAKRICQSPRIRVRVEGHTDERGSREYNVALGEKRANAVANILMLKGVSQNQISVVSYGREKPATYGTEETAWSKNRRAVIVYEVE